jgi:signal transduction histidine kinase
MAESKGLELINEIPDEEILLIADRIRIQQVLDNLVSNALKYTKYGKVTIKLEQSDDTVTMSVTDTGEGISAEDLNKLGQKFFRVKNFVKSEGKLGDRQIVRPGGTGIGLYVVFQLVKAMQGKIEVTSQLGEGSTFSVILPRYSPEKLQNMLSITKQS